MIFPRPDHPFRPTFYAVEAKGLYEIEIYPPPVYPNAQAKMIRISRDYYKRFLSYLDGELAIEEAFPDFSEDQRELISSGLFPDELNEIPKH
jgi:hypothetical protein